MLEMHVDTRFVTHDGGLCTCDIFAIFDGDSDIGHIRLDVRGVGGVLFSFGHPEGEVQRDAQMIVEKTFTEFLDARMLIDEEDV